MKFGPADVMRQVWNRRTRDTATFAGFQPDGSLLFAVRDGYRSWSAEEADAVFVAFPDGWRVGLDGRVYRPVTYEELAQL